VSQSQKDTKIYVEIVKELRLMIERKNLKPGDKLPSERELSERLNVGRSSVREALRALELLGLIETRRGEGTYIRDYGGHQLVQLLSTFILQDENAKRDIIETKYLIELDCLWLNLHKSSDEQLQELKNWAEIAHYTDDDFFLKVVRFTENHLFLRMWIILKDYYNSLHLDPIVPLKQEYVQLVEMLLTREETMVRNAYRTLRKLSKN
jgi:GntR family transcriptional regulator, transcriptional repressor for pyruvate dehydrogenase complex